MPTNDPQSVHLSVKQRSHAVSRLLHGEDAHVIAEELEITPRELEAWAREFCRAGEMRLRQLPDNLLERCLTAAEKLVPLATLISVLLAVTLFIQGQRKEAVNRAHAEAMERESRVRDAYAALDDKYLDYVKVCLDHPDLDVFDTPMVRKAPPTVEQQRQESMVLAMLTSMLERAYLMYSSPDDTFERNQWSAWSAYMSDWARRDNFRSEWTKSKTEFDPNFAAYIDSLIQSGPTTRSTKP
jgi:hypothetical protein